LHHAGADFPAFILEQLGNFGIANLGIAHDGDGDRLVVCDESVTVLMGTSCSRSSVFTRLVPTL
jgi:hypothetical protein